MNVNLSPTFESYIQKQLNEGTYNNASEVIREALRLKMKADEIYISKIEALKSAIVKGETSGEATAFDIDELISEAKNEANL